MTFGQKIRKYREDRHLSQQYIADLLGTTKQVISHYENGKRSPKIDILPKYADKLGLPLWYLVDDSINDPALPVPAPFITSDANDDENCDEEPTYLLASRSTDNREVQELSKKEYEALKNLISNLRQNDNNDL